MVTSEIALAPICASYNRTYSDIIPAAIRSETTTTATFGAILEGMFQSTSNKSEMVDVFCPGGNCTFPAYQSLGICHQCEDITNKLSYTRNGSKSDPEGCKSGEDDTYISCVYTLPNELELFGNFVFNSTVGNGAPGPNDVKDNMIFHPSLENINYVMQFTSIKSPGPSVGYATATQCMLYYCVHKYEGKSSIGRYTESKEEVPSIISNDAPGQTIFNDGSGVTVTPEYCTRNGSTKLPPYTDDDQCVYNFGGGTGRALFNTIARVVVGAVLKNSATGFSYKSPTMQAMYNNNKTDHSVNDVFKGIANVLTDRMRTSPDICGGFAPGIVSRTEPYMFVVWWWMIYPIFVVAATTLFLVLIMIKTRHHHIWKSSPLALVFSGLYQGEHMQAARILRGKNGPETSTMEDAAMGMRVRLREEGEWDVRHTVGDGTKKNRSSML